MAATDLKKGKIAKRVIAVLEYFDANPGYATVMDLVRAYDWPQSSTSELLASLVDLGILYKDRPNRSFIPTQRAALLGAWNQPTFVRGGGLSELVIRMAEATGLSVAIVGMIGVSAQVFSWHAGNPRSRGQGAASIHVGMTDQLTRTAPGWMLLGTKEISQRNRIVRRLNAESDSPFMPFAEMSAVIDATIVDGYAAGPLGLGSHSNCVALLVPGQPDDRQIAICCETGEQADTAALLSRMQGVLAESGWLGSAPAGYGQLYKAA